MSEQDAGKDVKKGEEKVKNDVKEGKNEVKEDKNEVKEEKKEEREEGRVSRASAGTSTPEPKSEENGDDDSPGDACPSNSQHVWNT